MLSKARLDAGLRPIGTRRLGRGVKGAGIRPGAAVNGVAWIKCISA